MNNEIPTYTSEERLLAAVCHLFGWLVALIIFLIEKGKSQFVRFQAIQSILFSVCLIVTMFILMGCTFTLIFGGAAVSMLAAAGAASTDPNSGAVAAFAILPMMGVGILLPCFGVLVFAIFAINVIVAILCLTGRNFRYPVLGNWAEKIAGGQG